MERVDALKAEMEKLVGFQRAAREEQRSGGGHDLILELKQIESRLATLRVEIFRCEKQVRRYAAPRQKCPCCERTLPVGVEIE